MSNPTSISIHSKLEAPLVCLATHGQGEKKITLWQGACGIKMIETNGDSVTLQNTVEATIVECGNGFPQFGECVYHHDSDQCYMVISHSHDIATNIPHHSNTITATLFPVDQIDCFECMVTLL